MRGHSGSQRSAAGQERSPDRPTASCNRISSHAADLDPDYKTPYSIRESVWTYLGRAYYEAGNFPEARQALEKALSIDKDNPLPKLYLGLTLLRSGDQQQGRRETENGLGSTSC